MPRILFMCVLLFSCSTTKQIPPSGSPEYIKEIKTYQEEANAAFANPETSPLMEEDLDSFKHLDFFPANEKYRVTASFVRTPEEQPFEMKTSTTRLPVYRKYGEITFTIDGQPVKLNVYQNVEHVNNPLFKNSLFLPFRDMTSGKESYGGGRYIDLDIPEGDEIIVDFNKAYNPYCAYSPLYSCPVPPKENDLDIAIRAGVMAFEGH